MGGGIGHPRPKGDLLFNIMVGRVGIEFRNKYSNRLIPFHIRLRFFIIPVSA